MLQLQHLAYQSTRGSSMQPSVAQKFGRTVKQFATLARGEAIFFPHKWTKSEQFSQGRFSPMVMIQQEQFKTNLHTHVWVYLSIIFSSYHSELLHQIYYSQRMYAIHFHFLSVFSIQLNKSSWSWMIYQNANKKMRHYPTSWDTRQQMSHYNAALLGVLEQVTFGWILYETT